MLLPFASKQNYINDPDPCRACLYHITEHPHYHSCLHCKHNISCEYGFQFLLDLRSLYNAQRYNLDLDNEFYTQELIDSFNALTAEDERFLQEFDEALQAALPSK